MTTNPHAQARAFVQAKLDDRLAPPEQAWLAAHLAGCEACRRYAAELSALERLLPETFQARWDSARPAARPARPGSQRPNPSAPVPIGGPAMVRQKVFNLAGITLGLGALVVLLIGFAFALQTATTPDSLIPGQAATGPANTADGRQVQFSSRVTFGEYIRLEGYNLRPGEGQVTVDLVWEALAEPPRDYVVSVQLRSNAEAPAVIAQSDETPVLGTRPTSGWEPGEFIVDPHTLVLPADVPIGKYALWISVFDPASGQALTITEPAEGPDDAVAVGTLELPLASALSGTLRSFTTPIKFGDAIALDGYRLSPGESSVTVELRWHALAAPPADYMVGLFVMPDGAQSAIFAQSDTVPAMGTRPTGGWQPGEYILDTHDLTVASDVDLDVVPLVLWVRVFDPATGASLPSDPAGGGPFNAISIGMVSMPAAMPLTATPLPFASDGPPVPCSGECTPTPTPACDSPCAPPPTATPCAEGFFGCPASEGPTYTVQAGDTLESIASLYGLTVEEIMAANGLTEPTIAVGQELYIPLQPLTTPHCARAADCPDATAAMAATLGWTPTPIGFVPSMTPCQAGCDSLYATGTAAALAGATGTPTPPAP